MQGKQPTVCIQTLGCKVNQYESTAIAERFSAEGFSVVQAGEVADICVVNTCTVTAESDRKARQMIRRMMTQNPNAYILVTGCYAQVAPQEVAKIKGVDYVSGNAEKLAVVNAAKALVARGKKNDIPEIAADSPDSKGFEPMCIHHFDRTRAYVKIEDGCESHCTYCIIPSARGKIRSKAPVDVLHEVEALTRGGCREIVLTGIETASYGRDLDGWDLARLLGEINQIEGVGRIRLGSLDPSLMKQSFVDAIAGLTCLAPHFHLSMQSGSDRVLARMKRKYNSTQALAAIERLRAAIPGVQLTTDIIVGFPGETEEDFEATMDFARRARFLMIHVFPYSKRLGTPAASMPDQIPNAVKKQRVAALSALAADIRGELLDELIDKKQPVSVLFETYENGMAIGHTPDFIEMRVPSDRPLHALTRLVLPTDKTEDLSGCIGQLI
jgi:threonylcarbamoyladenosine tRNA methylthiotransferase MtaB